MTNKKGTKRALLASLVSLLLCFSMLIGTTYAWFTDSVKSTNNIITAGNLDVELEFAKVVDGKMTDWAPLKEDSNVFSATYWEPGHAEVVYLRVSNRGTLSLKYQLGINIAEETGGTNVYGDTFKLSDYIMVGVDEKFDGNNYADRATAISKVTTGFSAISNGYAKSGELAPKESSAADYPAQCVALVVYMPETVENDANYKTGTTAPFIKLGISVFATQLAAEMDSFGPDYDDEAPVLTVKVTPQNVQEYLDGKHGSLSNTKLVLTAGNYDKLVIGTPTKYEGSNTAIYCENHDTTFATAEEYVAHRAGGAWDSTPQYTVTIDNLTIVAEDNVTVAGVMISSGHVTGPATDYVLDKTFTVGSVYYLTHKISNLTFENVDFTSKVNIETAQAKTVINGVTFTDCTFTTAGVTTFAATSTATLPAIRYYNEADNGMVSNLVVDGCSFNDCYQGVYTHHIKNVTVINSTFNNTVHNAIAVQDHDGACDHGNVVISYNTFDNIGDRVIRFNNIGARTNVEMKYNAASNFDGTEKEVVKATTIAKDATFDVNYNAWGADAVIPNDEFKNADESAKVSAANSNESLTEALKNNNYVILANGNYKLPASSSFKADTTIICNEDTVFEGKSGLNLNGATIVGGTFANNSGNAVSGTVNGTFKDCDFTGSNALRGCYAGETVVFENCTFSGDVYGVHFDGGSDDAIFKNCTFSGFNAMGSAITKLTLDGCTFVANGRSGYNGINLWGSTDLINCTFIFDGTAGTEWVNLANENKTVTFTNCIVTDGTNETPIEEVVGNFKIGNTVIVDGTPVVFFNDDLKTTVANGATKVLLRNGEYDLNGIQKDGLTLIGVENDVKMANTTKYASGKAIGAIWKAINLENMTITNTVYTMADGGKATFTKVNFANGFRQGYGTGIVFTDCTFGSNSEGYALHFQTDAASEGGLVKLTGCEFEGGKVHLGGKRAYEFTNCDFAAGTDFQVWSNITLDGCTVDGVAVNADNISTLFPNLNLEKVTIK